MDRKRIVESYEELKEQFKIDILNAFKPIAIIGGHYPVNRIGNAATHPCDYNSFGIFPIQTLHIASEMISFAKDKGKEAGLVLLVDDHTNMGYNQWYMSDSKADHFVKFKNRINDYFENFTIPENFQNILEQYGLNQSDIIPSKQGLAFQESFYRKKFAEKTGEYPGCAGEYGLVLDELVELGFGKLIALLPNRCQKPTSIAANKFRQYTPTSNMRVIHAYLSSNENNETPEQLLDYTIKEHGGIKIIR
ncbi:MAG: hypothetical protein ABH828_03870 [archaeon]